ncbi:MAG TPA: beta-propeller fold lactonase family protein [Acidisarcina sp.]
MRPSNRNLKIHLKVCIHILIFVAVALLWGCRRQHFPQYPPNYREYAYVTNGGSNTVTVLDVVNLRQDRVLTVGANPTGIGINPRRNEIYIVNSGSGTISVIDAEHNRVVATIRVRKAPYFIDVDAEGARAYVANSGSNNVSVIDLAARREIAAIGVGESPGMARIAPDGNTLVVTNRVGGSVTLINPHTYSVRKVFPGCPGATDAVILPDSSKTFVACSGGNQVMALGLARQPGPTGSSQLSAAEKDDHLLTYLDVGKTPVDLALKPDGGEIFVSNFDSDTISEISTSTDEVGGAYAIGEHPSNGIVSADNSTLWVSNFNADTIAVYGIDDGKRIGAVHVGDGPDSLALSARGHLLFAVNARSGGVSVVRTLSYSDKGVREVGALFTMLPAEQHPNAIAIKAFLLP